MSPPSWHQGLLKSALRGTEWQFPAPVHHPPLCQPAPHPKPGTSKQQIPHCSLTGPGWRDTGSFPRPAGLLMGSVCHSAWQAGGAAWAGPGGPHFPPSALSCQPAGGRGRGCPLWKRPPNRKLRRPPARRSTLPPQLSPDPKLHLSVPRPPFLHPIGSSWCIQDWGCGWGVAAGLKTLQASFWTPVKPAPHLSFYRESWGCSHRGNTSAEKWVGVPPQQRARLGSHHLATASPPLGITSLGVSSRE